MSIVGMTGYATSVFSVAALGGTVLLLGRRRPGPARTSVVVTTAAAYVLTAAGFAVLAIEVPPLRLPLLAGGIVLLTVAVAVAVRRGSRD